MSARAVFGEAVLQSVIESAGDIPNDLEVGGTWVSVAYHLQHILTERFLGADWRREYDDLPRAGIAVVHGAEKYSERVGDPSANVEAEVEAILEAEAREDLGAEAEAVLPVSAELDRQLGRLADLAHLTPYQLQALRARYNGTVPQLAKERGVTVGAVHTQASKAEDKVRKAVTQIGLTSEDLIRPN